MSLRKKGPKIMGDFEFSDFKTGDKSTRRGDGRDSSSSRDS